MKKILIFLLLFQTLLCYPQKKDYKVFNTSINTKYAELGSFFISNNEILFASSKLTDEDTPFKKDRRRNNRQLFLEFYFGIVTEDGNIIQKGKLNKEIYTKFNESDITFSPDLKTLYFVWNNYYEDQYKVDNPANKPLYLFKASVDKDYNISNIVPIRFNSKEYSIKNPKISLDGKKLFFTSNMPGGYGSYDIYVCEINEEGYLSWPKNLGDKINTSYAELYPYADANNNLYFSSFGHKGKGGLDIFKSELIENEYNKSVSLPEPINSKYDEFGYVEKPNSTSGFFTSNRKGGEGDVDIYGFNYTVPKEACNQLITGVVKDKITNLPLINSQIFLYKNNTLLQGKDLKNSNEFSFELTCNETYKIIAKKIGYITNEIEFSTNEINNTELEKFITLEPEKCINIVNGRILNAKTKDPLANASVQIYKNNILQGSININDLAVFNNYELECDTEYKITASLKDFKKDSVVINTSKGNNISFDKTLLLHENIEFVTVREQKMVKTNPIYFDLNKGSIRPDAAIELNKVVGILKKYPEIKIEVKAHTDSRAPDNYNLNLSNKRAQSTINYIISQGIDSERVFGKGYGETQLVNKCKNGVKCTEGEHQLNRRTEFIVIE